MKSGKSLMCLCYQMVGLLLIAFPLRLLLILLLRFYQMSAKSIGKFKIRNQFINSKSTLVKLSALHPESTVQLCFSCNKSQK